MLTPLFYNNLLSVAFSEGKTYSKAKANVTEAKKAWFSPAS